MKNKIAILLSLLTLSGCSTVSDFQYSMLEEKTVYKEEVFHSKLTGAVKGYSYLEYLMDDSGDFIAHEYGCSIYTDKHEVSFYSFYKGLESEFDNMYFTSTPVYIKTSDYLTLETEGFKFHSVLSGFDALPQEKKMLKYSELSLSEKYTISIPEINKVFKSQERNPEKSLKVMRQCLDNYYIERKNYEKSKARIKNLQII